MEFRKATLTDIQAIRDLVDITWPASYSSIITHEQIQRMLEVLYHPELLKNQIQDPAHHIILLENKQQLLGYAHGIVEGNSMKLSKIYFLPEYQGKGYGKILLQHMENKATEQGICRMTLNVNRQNPALSFYKKMGYEILEKVDIPFESFWLNDFILQKNLTH